MRSSRQGLWFGGFLFWLVLGAGCGGDQVGVPTPDAGATAREDAGGESPDDAGATAREDAGGESPDDAGVDDAGADDAGVDDAGADDAGVDDAGVDDAGVDDAGADDAGVDDAGVDDAGDTDAGEEPCLDGAEEACDLTESCSGLRRCVEGEWMACEAPAEVCDGLDNDCDGHVDNVAGLGDSCSVGVGQCEASGQRVCDLASGALVCDAVAGAPSVEVCDGLDNDCDGHADNVAGLGDSCLVGEGQCARAGALICGATSPSLVCSATPGSPVAETCNGLDDDCDGVPDNVAVSLVEENSYGSDQACSAMEVGDLNGDGRLDVVCAPVINSPVDPDTRLFTYLNQGQGNFSSASYLQPVAFSPFRAPSGLALGDVDGDGDLDIVAVGETMKVQVYRNDGSGGFAAPYDAFDFAVDGEPGSGGIALVDIDNDGDLDIVTSIGTVRQSTWSVVYSLNNGAGTFGVPQQIGSSDARAAAIRSVNLDGDNDVDLVVVYETKVDLYRATSPASFASATELATGLSSVSNDPLLADLDHDGFPDLLLTASGVRYYAPGVAGGFGSLQQTELNYTEVSAAAGAFDCDAGLEVIAVAANVGAGLSYLSAPETLMSSWLVLASPGHSIRVFDVDQDGDDDAVMAPLDGGIRVLLRP